MAATAFKMPMLAIESREAAMLADAVIDVGEQYNVPINPRVLCWINLLGAVGAVYAPRVVMLMAMSPPKRQAPPQSVAQAVQTVTGVAHDTGTQAAPMFGAARELNEVKQPPMQF